MENEIEKNEEKLSGIYGTKAKIIKYIMELEG